MTQVACRIVAAISAPAGAAVMSTGVVSVALFLGGDETPSRILLWLTGFLWAGMAAVLVLRALRDRDRVRAEARSPAGLTGVAATAVLGARVTLSGRGWVGPALLGVAVALWLYLLPRVLRHMARPAAGDAFLVTVSSEALAVLAAELARDQHSAWLLATSLALFAAGLILYPFVLASFDLRQLAVGPGDHWLTGGALAISALAAATIELAAEHLDVSATAIDGLQTASVIVWALAMIWLPALLVCEATSPRLHYGVRRWSTIFPLGMYAACSFVVASAVGAPAIDGFARVWVWVALAAWTVVFLAAVRRGVVLVRRARTANPR